jgi:hypothetical protein
MTRHILARETREDEFKIQDLKFQIDLKSEMAIAALHQSEAIAPVITSQALSIAMPSWAVQRNQLS